jgi:hypothetical protein
LESGNARKRFAPCSANYGATGMLKSNCDGLYRALRISQQKKARTGKRLWNQGYGWSMETFPYAKSEILTLQLRSMYLALALCQFVFNIMTGDLRTQWTWKQCLISAVEEMNIIGIVYYSNYRTLARWHRKLTKHRLYICKTPDAKT